jgi:hypothetical protein
MVYRLVMRRSIEEKILVLHDHKRDLADALLEDAASSAALTVDELLLLAREAGEEAAVLGARKRSDVRKRGARFRLRRVLLAAKAGRFECAEQEPGVAVSRELPGLLVAIAILAEGEGRAFELATEGPDASGERQHVRACVAKVVKDVGEVRRLIGLEAEQGDALMHARSEAMIPAPSDEEVARKPDVLLRARDLSASAAHG